MGNQSSKTSTHVVGNTLSVVTVDPNKKTDKMTPETQAKPMVIFTGPNFESELTCGESPFKTPSSVAKDDTSASGTARTLLTEPSGDETASVVSSLSNSISEKPSRAIKKWDGKKLFSDLILDGMQYLDQRDSEGVMIFEAPSSSEDGGSSFYNTQVFRFLDYPPGSPINKVVLRPCRYAMMNGDSLPVFLPEQPEGLVQHWQKTIPDFVTPTFVKTIPDKGKIYAYLPLEHVEGDYINKRNVHYHLAGKEALHLMSSRTPRLLSNTNDERPCVAKTTHSMGSKGIFVIRNDKDEEEFNNFLAEAGNPTFVVTEFVEIERNVACHFFLHPNGDIIWIGSNENLKKPDGSWSSDSIISMASQDELREMQLPFVKDVAAYCESINFWGFMGIDVLFDKSGKGYLVDLNPRVTGSCPTIMLARQLQSRFGFENCIMRRSAKGVYPGSSAELLTKVEAFNESHRGETMVILNSFYQTSPETTNVNVIVVGKGSIESLAPFVEEFAPMRS